jgi:septal ring factor EnvC (AmiA/AmiB activator)
MHKRYPHFLFFRCSWKALCCVVASIAFWLLLCLVPTVFWAGETGSDDIRESIRHERVRARAAEEALFDLTVEERKLNAGLARTADKLKRLTRDLRREEAHLAEIRLKEKQAGGVHAALLKRKEQAGSDLRGIVSGLWSFHVQREMVHRGRDIPTWDKAYRVYNWAAELYRFTDEKLEEVAERQREAAKALEKQRLLASELQIRLASVNKSKDSLLGNKLGYIRKLTGVRKEKLDHEAELGRILGAIETLNYSLEKGQQARGGPFAGLKGRLPWPAVGDVVARYGPKASPPRRGMGLRLREGSVVRAVSWGRVVHDDVLRGFGRVVILLHGEEFYSLYAYLAESHVKPGDEVEQGQSLGTAGFYPGAGGPGLYFELRFHQKAINPERWLIARK